jgi:hypothetical protein
MSSNFVDRLADVLIKIKALRPEERDAISINFKNRQKDNFGYFLLDEGLVSRQQLLRAYSLLYNLPSLDVQGFMFDHDLVTSFDKDVLILQEAIPVESDESIIIFCVSDPEKPGLEEELGKYTDSIIELQVGIGRDIIDAIEDYFEDVPDEMLYDEMEEEVQAESEEDVDYI